MNLLDVTARTALVSLVQIVVVVAGSPLLTGWTRQIKARMEGRAGGGVLQPWRDVRKLLRKDGLDPAGTGPVFRNVHTPS